MRGLRGGWSLEKNHVHPWTGRSRDLTDEKTREAAKNLLDETRPELSIAFPPCTLFSQMQNMSGGPRDGDKYLEAVKMVELALEMCEMQVRAGRKLIFEHPAFATSWALLCLRGLRNLVIGGRLRHL